MALERTLSIIKPDAVGKKQAGKIIALLEEKGFHIVSMKKIRLSQAQAQRFYAVHRERPFFNSLVQFMTSGPCIVMVLEKENAIADYRKVMGATDPAEAEDGTIRKLYAENKERNAVHGSDATETAKEEISIMFSQLELILD